MRLALALTSIALLVACKGDPVSWGDTVFGNSPLSPADTVAHVGVYDPGMCAVSMRAVSSGPFAYAAWWRVRPDSSVALVVARREPDQKWGVPVVADSSDNGVRGCGRPAPAISADSVSGYVHLAYFVEPAKGGGIFFAHSMDSAKTFHSAVPIVFGNNPGRVSVASHGDRVAVAYEDPNATEPLIGVALSRTMGHIFEIREQASSDNGRARAPTIRVDGDSIHLWWQEYSADPSVSATRPAYRSAEWR